MLIRTIGIEACIFHAQSSSLAVSSPAPLLICERLLLPCGLIVIAEVYPRTFRRLNQA